MSPDHANPRPRASERMVAIAERTGPRRSPAWLLVCVLALVTALLCYQVAASKVPPALPPPPPDRIAAAQVAVVHRFYTAVNTALRTGETTALEALVADDLIAHPAPVGTASGRAAFVQHLQDLRVLYPDLRLHVDDLQATHANLVSARVQVTGIASGTFLGLPVPDGVPAWPALEDFRLEGAQIVERWAGMEVAVDLSPLFAITQPAPPSGTAYLQVARVTYPPASVVPLWVGASAPVRQPTNVPPPPQHEDLSPRLTYLEAGIPTVPRESQGPAPRSPLTYLEVAAQTQVDGNRAAEPSDTIVGTLLPSGPGLSATVSENQEAVILEVTIQNRPPGIVNPIPERAPDVQATILATAYIAVRDWQQMTIAAGTVTLAPGATLAFPAAPGPLLLVGESGDLELTASSGQVAVPGSLVDTAAAHRYVAGPNQRRLPAGWTALVEAHATSLWHNPGAEPATVLVLVITPEGDVPAARLVTPLPAATPRDSWCTEPPGCR